MEELARIETKSESISDQGKTTSGDALPGRGLHSEEARLSRLEYLRKQSGASLDSLQTTRLVSSSLRGNIENFIGGIEIPLGVAGPLILRREGEAEEVIYAPLATTEGALVSSITRGAKAASLSGGIFAKALRQRMTRAPMFGLRSISDAVRFSAFTLSRFSQIQAIVKKHSNFAELIEIEPVLIGRTVHLCFVYETGDAAGQNMTTICTMSACNWLMREILHSNQTLDILDFVLDGSLSTDKKASMRSAIKGRGTQVVAECTLTRSVLASVLKVTPEKMVRNYSRAIASNLYSGSQSFNVNVANVIAGMFAATGQDIACSHESSVAQLHLELEGDDLYVSLTLPSIIVGTVGGGTRLTTQNEMLQLLKCEGPNQSARLAETIAAFALSLEISTLSALVGGQFASAHERLGRNKEHLWLKHDDLNDEFFTDLLRPLYPHTSHARTRRLSMRAGDSLVIESASQITKRLCGLFPFEVDLVAPTGKTRLAMLLKVKPTDREVILATELIASLCSNEVVHAYKAHPEVNPFYGCHIREMRMYEETDPRFTSIAPKFYANIQDDRREVFVIAMEYLGAADSIPSIGLPAQWTESQILTAIEGIAGFHSIWLGRDVELATKDWIHSIPSFRSLSGSTSLWAALAKHGRQEFPEWFSASDYERHLQLIRTLSTDKDGWSLLDSSPKTLIHNDFNPRNIAFRKTDEGKLNLCAYDWELATVHLPQRDLAELLCFTLDENHTQEQVLEYVDFHRRKLEDASRKVFDRDEWEAGFSLCLKEFMITRLSMYLVAHTHRSCEFLPRIFRTTRHLVTIFSENQKGNA